MAARTLTLHEKQLLFSAWLPALGKEARRRGYQVKFLELQRSKASAEWNATHCRVCKKHRSDTLHALSHGHKFRAIGIKASLHRLCLAIDLQLWKNGKLLDLSEQYRELGKWWKRQHPLFCWGGDFRNPDGGHFSCQHGGRK
jgi:aryl carrier-like protein